MDETYVENALKNRLLDGSKGAGDRSSTRERGKSVREKKLEEGKIKLYVDPSLTSSNHTYESFISEICSLHIADCTQPPKEHGGIFFL